MVHDAIRFCGELRAPRPTPKYEDHHLLAVQDRLFSIFAATLHIGGHSSICNLRMCCAIVTGTYLLVTLRTNAEVKK